MRTRMTEVISMAVLSGVLAGLALLIVIIWLANVTAVVGWRHTPCKAPCEWSLQGKRT